MNTKLEHERRKFEKHIEEWRQSHLGEFVLIKNDDVVGFFPSLEEAFTEGAKLFGMSDFFIEQIVPDHSVNISFVGQAI